NSSSTVILTDFYQRIRKRKASEKEGMKVLYISSVVVGTLGMVIALLMMRVDGVLTAWWKLASIFSGGMLGLFLLGFLSKTVKNPAAIAGVVAGLLVIAWMSLSPYLFTEGALVKYKCNLHGNLTIVLGTMTIFLVGFLVSLAMQAFSKKSKKPINKDLQE
ncbi:MAG TPA: sodium:solute symporter, partial [Bacteroidales bacterium]|nr:sodium:solute symporter [Bacteroidales bacterium]